MLTKAILSPVLKHFTPTMVTHSLFVTLFLCYYFVYNGLVREEANRTQIIHDGFSLVTTKSDKRKGSVFSSTPDYYLRLSELVPEVEAIIVGDEVELSFLAGPSTDPKVVAKNVPFFMVGSGFFDAVVGRFIQGRGFTSGEVFTGKPLVVMSAGLLVKLFGDYDRSPSTVQIGGIDFQVIGSWAFNNDDIIENQAIYLPIGLHQLLGKSQSTYVNNFVLRGESSETLGKLKRAIDKLQLDFGQTPVRPEFTFVKPKGSRKFDFISLHNKVYVDVIVWLSLISFIFCAWRDSANWISYSQRWAGITFMAKGNSEAVVRIGLDHWWFVQSISTFLSICLSITSLIILRFVFSYPLSPGPAFHPGIFFYLFAIPVFAYLIRRRGSGLQFNLK